MTLNDLVKHKLNKISLSNKDELIEFIVSVFKDSEGALKKLMSEASEDIQIKLKNMDIIKNGMQASSETLVKMDVNSLLK